MNAKGHVLKLSMLKGELDELVKEPSKTLMLI